MIKNLNEKLDKICKLPRVSRREVAEILKDCYFQGLENKFIKNIHKRKI